MRRLFWLAVGLGMGVSGTILFSRWLQRQMRAVRAAQSREAGRAGADVRGGRSDDRRATFLDAFREGMAEREAELRSPDSRS